METKTTQPLQLQQESHIGLQFAQLTTQNVLRRLVGGIPIRFRKLSSGDTDLYEFSGNGMEVSVQIRKKGGKV